MIGLVLTAAALIVGTSGSPMLRGMKNMDSACMMDCVSKMDNSTFDVSIGKSNTNYGKQFGDMDKACEKIADTRDCIAKCDTQFNPFDMKSMKLMCSDENRAELKKHSACYNDQGNATKERCDQICGPTEEKAGELKESIIAMNKSNTFNFDELIDSMGDMCTIAKCHARCSRDAFNELCQETDPDAGTFMQKFSEEILGALNDDLKQFGMRKLMKGIIPKECHFVFYPEQLFSDSTTTESESSAEEDSKMRNLFSDLMSSPDTFNQKEGKLEETQMRLLDKEERNLDKQIEKLNLEIDMLNKKLAL